MLKLWKIVHLVISLKKLFDFKNMLAMHCQLVTVSLEMCGITCLLLCGEIFVPNGIQAVKANKSNLCIKDFNVFLI